MRTMHPSLATRLTEQAATYGVLMLTVDEHTAMRHYIVDHPKTSIACRNGQVAYLAHMPVYILPSLEATP